MFSRKEFYRYLSASFIIVICMNATMMTDAFIGSHYLGENTLSVIDLLIPFREYFYCLFLLTGTGAVMLSAKDIGGGRVEDVRRRFTVSSLSLLVCLAATVLILYLFRDSVVGFLAGGSALEADTGRYYSAILPWYLLFGMLILLKEYTIVSGRPLLAMGCALVQFILNLALSFLFLGVFGCGIEGLAWSSIISTLIGLLMLLPYCLSRGCPFRMVRVGPRQFFDIMKENVRYGTGVMVSDLSYMALILIMNVAVLRWMGEKALLDWSVVVIVYLICSYASTASQEACISLGGRYQGKGDRRSSDVVFRKVTAFLVCWAVISLCVLFLWPERVLPLFGVRDFSSELPFIIALALPFIFNSNILPLSLLPMLQRGRIVAYSFVSVSLYLIIPLLFMLFHLIAPGYEWWSFPALLPVQAVIVKFVHMRYGYLSRS